MSDRGAAAARAVERRTPRSFAFVREWVKRFFQIEGIDRSIVVAAQAFTALFPLLIVYASIAPKASGEGFAAGLIDRFDLSGSAADSLSRAFAPPETVESSISVASVLFLLVAALSFTRSMQRTFERSWGLDPMGLGGTKFGLAWLGLVAIAYSLRPATTVTLGRPALDLAVTIALSSVAWLLTPYLLLARRISWRTLVPGAVLTSVAMSILGAASLIYVPHNVAASAEQFGVIGVAFALLGWLVAAGFVITITATGGAVIAEFLPHRLGGELAHDLALEDDQSARCEREEQERDEDRPHERQRPPGEKDEGEEGGARPDGA